MSSSFRGRLILLITATLTLSVAALCLLQVWFNYTGLMRRAPGSLGNRATVLAAHVQTALLVGDKTSAQRSIGAMAADRRVVGAWVYRTDKSLFASLPRPHDEWPQIAPFGPSHAYHGQLLTVRAPIDHDGERLGVVVLLYDLGPIFAEFWRNAALAATAAAGVIILAMFIVRRVEGNLTRPLAELADVATQVSQTGDYSLRAQPGTTDELHRLANGFNAMMDQIQSQQQQLAAARDTLEQRVAERTIESQRRAIQLRALAAELTQAEERERKRLAHALHDDLQQLLVAARMRLDSLAAEDNADTAGLDQTVQLIQDAIGVSRSLTSELAPPILYDAGLEDALQWMVRSKEKKYDLKVTLDADKLDCDLDETIQAFVFRSVKELLFNIVKHAGVLEATIRLRQCDDQFVTVTVEDEGCGFDPEVMNKEEKGGFGLFSIRERLEFFGGRFEVQSSPQGKTAITLHAPCRPQGSRPARSDDDRPAIVAPDAAAPAPVGSRLVRVMLADDHKILRDGVAFILNSHESIEVVGEASNGAEAIELAQKLKPDVIVMDVSMPGMSGIEATRRITSQMPDVRVVGLSMHEERDLANHMTEAGASAYLTKGGPVETLVSTILQIAPPPAA